MPSKKPRNVRRRQNRQAARMGLNPRPATYSQLTVPGSYAFGGLDQREIIHRSDVSYEEIQLMLDMDGHARALFNILRRPILRNMKKAEVVPPKGGGEAETAFIESNLFGMPQTGGMTIPFTKVAAHQCMAFVFGHKPFEKVFWRPGDSPAGDGYIRLRKMAHVDSKTVKYLVDNEGEFAGFVQNASWKGQMIRREVDRRRAVLFNVDEEESDLYGKSFFLPAYYNFDKKHKIYYIMHLALAVGAIPPRLAQARGAVSDEDKRVFLEALSNLGANSAMLLPPGFEVLKDIDFKATSGMPYIEAIQHHNLEMSQAVLAQVLDMGTESSGGGFSSNKLHADTFFMTLEGVQDGMLDMWNKDTIPELVWWNFGTKNFPRVVVPDFSKEHRELIKETFDKITGSRDTIWSPEFLAEVEKDMANELGYDVDDESIMSNAKRQVQLKEIEKMASEASKAVGKDVRKENALALLEDPKFIAWAESYSGRYRESLIELGLIGKDQDRDLVGAGHMEA